MPESLAHAETKNDLYWLFCMQEIFAEQEKQIGKNRTDLSTEIKGFPLAIEVQTSYISEENIFKRMYAHTKKGFYTIWIFTEDKITNWKLLIQQRQNGVIFFFRNGKLWPARIDNVMEFGKNEIIGTNKKYINYFGESIEFEELTFIQDELYSFKTVTFDIWWMDAYLDLMDTLSF